VPIVVGGAVAVPMTYCFDIVVRGREKETGVQGARLTPRASSYAPPYRLYGVF
jgi:hypothetical protein